jgi:hypothetical protein
MGEDVARRDRGSMLVLTMLLVVVCGMMIFPLLEYGSALVRQSKVAHNKVSRIEGAKAGLRMALADPIQLYRNCGGTSVASPLTLSNAGISVPITTTCAQVAGAAATDTGRYANAIIGAGAPLAPELSRLYPGSASTTVNQWINDSTLLETSGKVWHPDLPVHDLSTRVASGWQMPSDYGACTVFFPGTYGAALTLDQNRSYYFTSGVYYFTNTVTIRNPARVVVGSGAVAGCASDQEAAFDATGAPMTHAITGAGATFVFGGAGRLLLETVSTTGQLSVQFNQRYVDPVDLNSLPSAGVSIMSVNGTSIGGTFQDFVQAGRVNVPRSWVGGAARRLAIDQSYQPSTLVPASAESLTAFTPLISVRAQHNIAVKLQVPGYVAVPQGRVDVAMVSPLTATNSVDVLFEGGVLATSVTLSGVRPRTLRFDVILPIVQRMFKITTTTTSGTPAITSTALVQVNQNGAYAVNSWVTG